jgi:hypothetical protein
MGYYIEMKESIIKIKRENYNNVIESLKKWASKKTSEIRYVYTDDILDSGGIDEVMEAIRYPIFLEDDYCHIDFFSGQKLGDDLEIFSVIAPFIEEDGYIEYIGEDGVNWRYLFKDGEVKEIYPILVWEEE